MVAVLIDFDWLAALVLEAFGFNDFLEEDYEFFLVLLDSPLHTRVPVVLDGVVGPPLKNVRDVRPLIGLVTVEKIEDPFLLPRPWSIPFDHWIQVVVPSLSALLSNSSWKMVRDFGPQVRAIDVDQMKEESVLNVRPRSLHQLWIQNFLPSVQALHVRPAL